MTGTARDSTLGANVLPAQIRGSMLDRLLEAVTEAGLDPVALGVPRCGPEGAVASEDGDRFIGLDDYVAAASRAAT
nr:hypothetical protein [Myxococcota bacterium]